MASKKAMLSSMVVAALAGCTTDVVKESSEESKPLVYGNLHFITPRNNAVYHSDVSDPFILLWTSPQDRYTLTLITREQKTQKEELFIIPSASITTYHLPEGMAIEAEGHHVGQQRRFTPQGIEERVMFFEGEYETQAFIETEKRIDAAKVRYTISQ